MGKAVVQLIHYLVPVIRDFAVSHQIDWWLKFLRNSQSSRANLATIYSLQRRDEIVAGPSGKPSVRISERSHQLNWWLTAKPLLYMSSSGRTYKRLSN
jgi:hypothetical protein